MQSEVAVLLTVPMVEQRTLNHACVRICSGNAPEAERAQAVPATLGGNFAYRERLALRYGGGWRSEWRPERTGKSLDIEAASIGILVAMSSAGMLARSFLASGSSLRVVWPAAFPVA